MIEVKEVKTRRQQKEFLDFPLKLYKDNPNYVPPLYLDEKKIFKKDYAYYDTCEAVYFNAYKDGVMAGRISGILQKAHNEKTGEKRVRFTRFDVVEDFEVAKALFAKVEDWALSKGMEIVCGPMSFSDFEREGMLIEGFDQLSTFEEQYNAPYYPQFVERLGFVKEVDWVESKVYAPKDYDGSLEEITELLFKRYHLHFGESKNGRDFLRRYADGFFDIVDKSYEEVYGTVPFTERIKRMMIDNFNLIIDNKHGGVVLDENGKVILLGICFPSLAKAVQKSGGHLTPGCLIRILKAVRKPEIIDLGLIGVDPVWANRGVSVAMASQLMQMLQMPYTQYAETNLNLEDNYAILNLWKRFDAVQHKRRRSYIKHLNLGLKK